MTTEEEQALAELDARYPEHAKWRTHGDKIPVLLPFIEHLIARAELPQHDPWATMATYFGVDPTKLAEEARRMSADTALNAVTR